MFDIVFTKYLSIWRLPYNSSRGLQINYIKQKCQLCHLRASVLFISFRFFTVSSFLSFRFFSHCFLFIFCISFFAFLFVTFLTVFFSFIFLFVSFRFFPRFFFTFLSLQVPSFSVLFNKEIKQWSTNWTKKNAKVYLLISFRSIFFRIEQRNTIFIFMKYSNILKCYDKIVRRRQNLLRWKETFSFLEILK